MGAQRFAIVGGDGAVGRLLGGLLADAGHAVVVVDRAGDPPLDATRPSPALAAALADCDGVVLAVSEEVALDALPHVIDALRPGALLVDTLSVKTYFIADAVARADGRELELLSLNPMFAPDLGLDGRPVLAVEATGGPRSDALLALLRERARVVTVADATTHDRMTAALQVAPHASVLGFGMALDRLGADLDALLAVAPPPFLALLALYARIVSGSPATYADIQRLHPYARDARRAVVDGVRSLDEAQAIGPDVTEMLLEQLCEQLGDRRAPLAEQAADLLAQVRPPS